jgi:hypothetical protein
MVIFMKSRGKENQISKSRFKAHALEIFRQIETGKRKHVVITDHGCPVLEIRKFNPQKLVSQNPLEALRGSVLWFERPFDPVGEDDWQAMK